MKKFAVHYLSQGFSVPQVIHIAGTSEEDAVKAVANEGVGFDGKKRIYPDQILGVEERVPSS